MRLFHPLFLLPLLVTPVLAEPVMPPAAEHHGRRSVEQHFAEANSTRNGRLTLDQAAAGYKSIAKSFTQIDVNRRGYVTLDDIKAWKAAKKAARLAAKQTAPMGGQMGGTTRPGPAIQRGAGSRATNMGDDPTVPVSTGTPRRGVDLPIAPLDRPRPS